jgi:hypothetical protein
MTRLPTDARVVRPTQVARWPLLDGDFVGMARGPDRMRRLR